MMKGLFTKMPRMIKGAAILLAIFAAATLAWAVEEKESEEKEVKVTLEQVPAPVKATFEQESKGGKIKEIVKETEDGRTTYEAEIVIGGKETDVKVGEDGKVLERESSDEEKVEKGKKDDKDDDEKDEKDEQSVKLTLEQVPAPVRATMQRESEGARIVAVEKETEDGKVQYAADLLKGKDKSEIKVAEDGKFLGRELIITLKQAPAAVQATLKAEAKGGKIGEEIEKLVVGGKTIKYTADITAGKKSFEVEVAENGKVLKREAAKEEKDEDKKDEKDEERGENAVKMTLDQVPAAVKATLEKESQGGKITALEQETEDGQRVYSADLEIGGKAGEILIAPDGKVIKREGAAEKNGK